MIVENVVENFRLTAALSYAARGWRVLPLHYPAVVAMGGKPAKCSCRDVKGPCGSIGKHPMTERGLKDATTDEATIRGWWKQWPAANVGIVTGRDSGLYVVDIDAREGGSETWQSLADSYGDPDMTPMVETGGGGVHLFFQYPPGNNGAWRNTAGRLGKGIDTRGEGGYVVAAPSLHESGNRYEWRIGPEAGAPAMPPPWLLAQVHAEPVAPAGERQQQQTTPVRPAYNDAEQFWLGKALARATEGTRNETGFWLATQLRDAGVAETSAAGVMRAYADRVPRGQTAYTIGEALASLAQAYAKPPRETARGAFTGGGGLRLNGQSVGSVGPRGSEAPPEARQLVAGGSGATGELRQFMEGIIDGTIYAAPMPWPILTALTQALIPGTITVVVGDPGVRKTYLVLECLLHWAALNIPAAVYFIEKRRRFYTMRFLAMLEGSPKYLDFAWIKDNPAAVREALDRHAAMLDLIGREMYSSDGAQVNLDDVLAWIRQMASAGKRVIIVDPITAVDAEISRWRKDTQFVLEAENVAAAHGASLLFISHSQKGKRTGSPTGHDQALGAAYFRFSDTDIWLHMPPPGKPRKVRCRSAYGLNLEITPPMFVQIHKARNGKGAHHEIAFTFGDSATMDSSLRFAEQGVVLEDVKD